MRRGQEPAIMMSGAQHTPGLGKGWRLTDACSTRQCEDRLVGRSKLVSTSGSKRPASEARKGQEAHLCPTYLAPRQLSDEELGACRVGSTVYSTRPREGREPVRRLTDVRVSPTHLTPRRRSDEPAATISGAKQRAREGQWVQRCHLMMPNPLNPTWKM